MLSRYHILLGSLGATAFSAFPPARALGAEVERIRIGTGPSDQASALLYAEHAGLFRAANIDVQITKMKGGAEIAAAVTGGSLDLGIANLVTLITAHARGLPFMMVAPTTLYRADYHPDEALIVSASSSIRSARDLIGKTISVVSLQDIFTLSLNAWLDQNNVDPKSVHFVEIAPSAAPAALIQGRIDAAIVFQPVMQDAVQSKNIRIAAYPLNAIGKRLEVAAVFGTSDWINAHREIVERFNRALLQSSTYISSHESESAPLLATFTGVELETVQKVPRPSRALYIDPANIQPLIDAAAKYNFVSSGFPASDIISAAALRPSR